MGQDITIVSDPNLDGWINPTPNTALCRPTFNLVSDLRFSPGITNYVSFDLTPLNGKKIQSVVLHMYQSDITENDDPYDPPGRGIVVDLVDFGATLGGIV